MDKTKLSFCESVYAGPASSWHLRLLTDKGPKYGGGVDTPSLCGHVKPPQGWDLQVKITQFHLDNNTCKACLGALVDAEVKKVDEGKQ